MPSGTGVGVAATSNGDRRGDGVSRRAEPERELRTRQLTELRERALAAEWNVMLSDADDTRT